MWGERFDGKGKERVTRNGKDPVIVETPEASSGGRPSGVELGDFFDLSFFFLEKEKGDRKKMIRNNLHLSFPPPLLSSPLSRWKLCVYSYKTHKNPMCVRECKEPLDGRSTLSASSSSSTR